MKLQKLPNSCDDIHNALYKKPSTRQYYLVLNNKDCNELDFSRVCNVLAEYAAKLPNEYAGEAYYKEHYELMIGEKALQKLKICKLTPRISGARLFI